MQFNSASAHKKMDLRFYWRQVCQRPWLIVALVLVRPGLGGIESRQNASCVSGDGKDFD